MSPSSSSPSVPLPWIALVLASSFAIYGLIRKKLALDALTGLLIETLIMLPPAAFYLWGIADSPTSHLTQNDWHLNLLLIAAGAVTTAPCSASPRRPPGSSSPPWASSST